VHRSITGFRLRAGAMSASMPSRTRPMCDDVGTRTSLALRQSVLSVLFCSLIKPSVVGARFACIEDDFPPL